MAGRPRKNEQKKKKNRNGTGTISSAPQKVARKKRLEKYVKYVANVRIKAFAIIE